jgi:hypothetical protein
MNISQPAEEAYVEQDKDGDIHTHEDVQARKWLKSC